MRFSTKSRLIGCRDIIFYISCGKPLGGAVYSALEVISTDFIDIDVFQLYVLDQTDKTQNINTKQQKTKLQNTNNCLVAA